MRIAGMALGAASIVGIVTWWMLYQWNECREAGFSILYCLQHLD